MRGRRGQRQRQETPHAHACQRSAVRNAQGSRYTTRPFADARDVSALGPMVYACPCGSPWTTTAPHCSHSIRCSNGWPYCGQSAAPQVVFPAAYSSAETLPPQPPVQTYTVFMCITSFQNSTTGSPARTPLRADHPAFTSRTWSTGAGERYRRSCSSGTPGSG